LWRQRIGEDIAREITHGAGYDYQPDFTPDGKRIVFARYDGKGVELHEFDLDSRQDWALTTGGDVNLEPRVSPDGERVRSWLEEEASRALPPLRQRWADALGSFDNRRFFQGYAEVVTAALITRSGWTLDGLEWPGPTLPVRDPQGRAFDALVLAFVRQVRPLPDRIVLERLANAINRVGGRSRIVVCVRKWLPHDFDPEPVRRAIDLWLTDADRSSLNSRYATYDDEHTSLEFALTNAEGPFEDRYHSTIGRTSIAPPSRAAGMRAASSIAASRLSASKMSQPPSASLVSTNGPSVVSVRPSCTRTVVAVSGSSSWRPGVTPGVSLSAR